MRCGSKGTARRGNGGPTVTSIWRGLAMRWPAGERRCPVGAERGLVDRLMAQARGTGERVPLGDLTPEVDAANIAMRWSRSDHRVGSYLGLAWSGRYAELGLVGAGDDRRLAVTTWNPDGSVCRRSDFERNDIEIALIELEAQGDLPAVLVHPFVTDFV